MKRMILVDGNSLMYRAYYGMGDPTKMKPNSKGIYTNAVNAFIRMIHTLLKKGDYDNVLIAFDAGKHTFRHDIQPDYKAGRAHMPDEMRMQIAYLKDFLTRSNIAQFEIAEYEADDIVGTMSKLAENNGYHVDIYSSDRDLLQLISENTTVHMTIKGMSELEDYTPAHFEEVYGIKPSQFIDLKALMGDKSDNISGVPGIGPKKGEKLLQTYGTIEGILDHIEEIKGADKQKFIDNEALVRQCKVMVTILRDAPIGLDLAYTEKKEPNLDKLKELYESGAPGAADAGLFSKVRRGPGNAGERRGAADAGRLFRHSLCSALAGAIVTKNIHSDRSSESFRLFGKMTIKNGKSGKDYTPILLILQESEKNTKKYMIFWKSVLK